MVKYNDEYENEDDDDEKDLEEEKERRQRRFKNKNRRDKDRYSGIRQEKIASRPRQRFNMNNFDLDEWDEWGDDLID